MHVYVCIYPYVCVCALTRRGGEEGACSAVRASTTSLEGPLPMVLMAATRKS